MPPEIPETTRTPPSRAEVRQRAHDALDKALTTRTVRGQETTGINLSLLTDKLRDAGVSIEVGRRRAQAALEQALREEIGVADSEGNLLPSWATAPVKTVGGATFVAGARSGESTADVADAIIDAVDDVVEGRMVDLPFVHFSKGSRVRTRPGVALEIEPPDSKAGQPPIDAGEVRRVFANSQTGVWLAEVQWDNGQISQAVACAQLEHAAAKSLTRGYTGDEGFTTVDPLSEPGRAVMRELVDGEGWRGTKPAEGSRRHIIRGAILEAITDHPRAFDAASRLEQSLKLADAVESALLDVGALQRPDRDHHGEVLTDQLLSICKALDSAGIPLAINADVLTPLERVEELAERYARQRATIANYGFDDRPATTTAEDLLKAAQHLPEDDYNRLGRALAWDTEDLETAARLDDEQAIRDIPDALEDDPSDPANEIADALAAHMPLSEATGQRIAKTFETLTVSVGGALRELLDRTATDGKDDFEDSADEGMGT